MSFMRTALWGSGGKGILVEIPAYLRPFEGKRVLFFLYFCADYYYN